MDPDHAWERYGSTEPYFGVLADERFEGRSLTDQARSEFFRTGEEHVDRVMSTIRAGLAPEFSPSRALDFGCGVGRLLLPLARRVPEVVGLDVSHSMIAEARRNVSDAGLTNVTVLQCDERSWDQITGLFDLVHAFIVFQHIPPRVGLRYFEALLARVAPGGIGAVHFVYGVRKPAWKRALHWARKTIPGMQPLANLAQGHPVSRPFMQMNSYPLDRLFRMLQDTGFHRIAIRYSDHGGFLGMMLLFQRVREPSW